MVYNGHMTGLNGHRDSVAEQMVRVGVVALDGFSMMSFSAAVEPLRAANHLAQATLYEVIFVGAEPESRSSGGASIAMDADFSLRSGFDIVLLIAGSQVGGEPLIKYRDRALFHWLRYVAQRGVLVAGVSGAPAVLALAGLMNRHRMTVHWDHAESLVALLPEVVLERSRYVRDRNRLTCAGGIAPLDMMHALIGEHRGPDFARRVSDWFLHTEIQQSEDPQRAGVAERFNLHNKALLDVIELMENHIADPLDLEQLARVAALSQRQLNRLFRDKVGLSTIAFYRKLRLDKACGLLNQTALSVHDIAMATGFFDTAHFGRCFKRAYHCTPSDMRVAPSA